MNQLENITLLPCSCERGTMSCPKGAEGPDPPKVEVNIFFKNLILIFYMVKIFAHI